MSGSSKCGRCDQTVYPVEGLRCLDKIWHKGCFKCHECNMTLSLKNYKGFDKKPYCNAHCPQAKATTVADTPEIRRLAENTRIQSQAKYHEDFEKSKKKGFTTIADDPETIRLKNTSKIISNAAYHGELERKKQMEEKRSFGGSDAESNNNNNANSTNNNLNNGKQRVQINQSQDIEYVQVNQMSNNYPANTRYQPQIIQQIHMQQQQQLQKQQQHLKQQELMMKQQQQQQIMYAQDYQQHHHSQNGVNQVMRPATLQHPENSLQRVSQSANQQQVLQPYAVADPHHHHQQQQQQQQQILMRQHQMMLQQSRHQAMEMNRQLPRQNSGGPPPPSAQLIKHPQMVPVQQSNQLKYVPISDVVPAGQMSSPTHLVMNAQMMNHHQQQQVAAPGGIPNGQRLPQNAQMIGLQAPHRMILGYPAAHQQQQQQHSLSSMNSANAMQQAKQQQYLSSQATNPPRQHLIQPNQIQPGMGNPHQQVIRAPASAAMQHQQMQYHHHLPSRVFRAIYDYEANDVDEVSFFESDFLVDCVEAGGNWLIGKVARTGQEGMFPANYVAAYSGQ